MRDLKWRQRQTGKTEYELEINADHTLVLQQNLGSENDGTGTGGTVWPAAHMLARYLAKRRFPSGWTCLDLGTGTGRARRLAAAALGPSKVALTDLSHALDMARVNVERNNLKAEVCALDWSNPRDSKAFDLVQQYDVVLAAECILPKLYPLEPFVGCLDSVIGPSTEALVAVELRTWHEFDPKARFVELCASQGLRVETITEGLDPDFIADDLELWRVTRGASTEKQHDWVQVTKWDADEVRLDCDLKEGRFSVVHVQQRNISERTWPSSIASSRAVVTGFWDVCQRRARAGTWERWRPRGVRAGSIGLCCDGDGFASEYTSFGSVFATERRPRQSPGASLRLEPVSCKCSAVPGRTVGCPAAQRLRLRRFCLYASGEDRRRFVLRESPNANFNSERAADGPRGLFAGAGPLRLVPAVGAVPRRVVSALARGLFASVAAAVCGRGVVPWLCRSSRRWRLDGAKNLQTRRAIDDPRRDVKGP